MVYSIVSWGLQLVGWVVTVGMDLVFLLTTRLCGWRKSYGLSHRIWPLAGDNMLEGERKAEKAHSSTTVRPATKCRWWDLPSRRQWFPSTWLEPSCLSGGCDSWWDSSSSSLCCPNLGRDGKAIEPIIFSGRRLYGILRASEPPIHTIASICELAIAFSCWLWYS